MAADFAVVVDMQSLLSLSLAKQNFPLMAVWLADDVLWLKPDFEGSVVVGIIHPRKSFSLCELARGEDAILMRKWLTDTNASSGVLLVVNQVERNDEKGGWRAMPLLFTPDGGFLEGKLDILVEPHENPPDVNEVRSRVWPSYDPQTADCKKLDQEEEEKIETPQTPANGQFSSSSSPFEVNASTSGTIDGRFSEDSTAALSHSSLPATPNSGSPMISPTSSVLSADTKNEPSLAESSFEKAKRIFEASSTSIEARKSSPPSSRNREALLMKAKTPPPLPLKRPSSASLAASKKSLGASGGESKVQGSMGVPLKPNVPETPKRPSKSLSTPSTPPSSTTSTISPPSLPPHKPSISPKIARPSTILPPQSSEAPLPPPRPSRSSNPQKPPNALRESRNTQPSPSSSPSKQPVDPIAHSIKRIHFGYLRKPDKLGFWVARLVVFDSRQQSLIYASFDKHGALQPPEHISFSRITRTQLSVLSPRQFEIDEDVSARADLGERPVAKSIVTHRFLCDDDEDASEWISLIHSVAAKLADVNPPPQRPTKPSFFPVTEQLNPQQNSAATQDRLQPVQRAPLAVSRTQERLLKRQQQQRQDSSTNSRSNSSTKPLKVQGSVPPPPPPNYHQMSGGPSSAGKKAPPPPPPPPQNHHVDGGHLTGKKAPPPPPPPTTVTLKKIPPPPPVLSSPATPPSKGKIPPPPPPPPTATSTVNNSPPTSTMNALKGSYSARLSLTGTSPTISQSNTKSPSSVVMARVIDMEARTVLNSSPILSSNAKQHVPTMQPGKDVLHRSRSNANPQSRDTLTTELKVIPPPPPSLPASTPQVQRRSSRLKADDRDLDMLRHIHSSELRTRAQEDVPVWMLPRSSRPREAPPPPPRKTKPGFYDDLQLV